jgi:hypothetical protein
VRRGWKLGFGIPMVLLGFFLALGGAAGLFVFGLDGSFELRSSLDTSAHAIVFDALSLRGLRATGAWRADVRIEVSMDDGSPAFVGVGTRRDVERYLAEAVVDRVIRLRPIGGLELERAEGPSTRSDPGPPATTGTWEASAAGDPAVLTWTAASGDWTVAVMRADGAQGFEGEGSLRVTIPAVGPLALAGLVAGLALLGGGSALIVSAARTPRRSAPPPRPDDPSVDADG